MFDVEDLTPLPLCPILRISDLQFWGWRRISISNKVPYETCGPTRIGWPGWKQNDLRRQLILVRDHTALGEVGSTEGGKSDLGYALKTKSL